MYDYKTSVGIAKFATVCGWVLVVISIINTLVALWGYYSN